MLKLFGWWHVSNMRCWLVVEAYEEQLNVTVTDVGWQCEYLGECIWQCVAHICISNDHLQNTWYQTFAIFHKNSSMIEKCCSHNDEGMILQKTGTFTMTCFCEGNNSVWGIINYNGEQRPVPFANFHLWFNIKFVLKSLPRLKCVVIIMMLKCEISYMVAFFLCRSG